MLTFVEKRCISTPAVNKEKLMKRFMSTIFNVALMAGIASAAWASETKNARELKCLADNIYFEARGESVDGQIAVAQVVLNRVNDSYFPNSVCAVVYQRSQFSWTLRKNHRVNDRDSYEFAELVAELSLDGRFDDITNGATFYHTDKVNPRWNRQMDVSVVIGDHIFYTWDGKWD